VEARPVLKHPNADATDAVENDISKELPHKLGKRPQLNERPPGDAEDRRRALHGWRGGSSERPDLAAAHEDRSQNTRAHRQ